MNTLISRRLVVPGEAEINIANLHGEHKSLQLLFSQISVFKVFYYLKMETIVSSKCGLKNLAWRLLVWPTRDVD